VNRRLAVVVAHPDDDTYGCAGTVALHAEDPGFHFTLIHATSGEAGMISDPSLATRETLGEVREEEDRRAWLVLGRQPDRHEWFRYPDGALAAVPFEELVGRICAVFLDQRPDVVMTIGPDGVTGHPDHIMAGFAATVAFHRIRERGGPGFRRLIWNAIPQSAIDQWNRARVAAGEEPFDPTRVYDPRGVPDEMIGVDIDVSSVASQVVASLREHRTQAGEFGDVEEDEQIASVSREHGVVAWPLWRPGDPVLRDAFEGL